jgi:hypothetical protein
VLRGEVAQRKEAQRPSQLRALLIVFSLLKPNLPVAGGTCAKGAERRTDMPQSGRSTIRDFFATAWESNRLPSRHRWRRPPPAPPTPARYQSATPNTKVEPTIAIPCGLSLFVWKCDLCPDLGRVREKA